MTTLTLRTDPDQDAAGSDHLLDLFGVSNFKSTIHLSKAFFDSNGTEVSEPYRTLFETACAVFVSDKVVSRKDTDDAWTRTLDLTIPGYPSFSDQADRQLESMLNFLTGDRWTIHHDGDPGEWDLSLPATDGFDAVCLFSGGLDSFAGAVQLLEKGNRVLLVGHNDSSVAPNRQRMLCDALEAQYPDMAEFRGIRVSAMPESDQQEAPLETVESTYRSRSIIFIATGLLAAGANGEDTPLYVPENGLISLNVPLNPSRRGTASTRTTHPHYMAELATFAAMLGVNHNIVNPFQFATKGDMMKRFLGLPVFTDNVHNTVSCSRPERRNKYPGWKFVDRTKANCGYCFPCVIRRAALHAAGLDDPSEYRVDIHSGPQIVDHASQASRDLRAVIGALNRGEHPDDILRTGSLPGRHADYYDVHVRGRAELRTWLQSAPANSQIAGLVT